MTVLSSKDGKFYEVPEDALKGYEVPADRVNEILAELDDEMGAEERYSAGPVTIYVTGAGAYVEPASGGAPVEAGGDVEPYGHHHHGHRGGGFGGPGFGFGGPGFGFGFGPYGPFFYAPRRRRHRHW